MPWIDKEKCKGCAVCLSSCPDDAIIMKDNKAVIDQNKCTRCGKCFSACPTAAIRPNREKPELRGKFRPQGHGLGRRQEFGQGQGRGMGRRRRF